jgi:hypothetical protein
LKFVSKPLRFWTDVANAREFLDRLGQTVFKINKPEDWYRISGRQLISHGGSRLLQNYGQSMANLVTAAYPDYPWNVKKFHLRGKKSVQRWLWLKVQEIFPGQSVLEDFRHPEMSFEGTHVPIELDIFLPDLNLAFEYQGEQHYRDMVQGSFSPIEVYELRDREKRALCAQKGVILVDVPYWWDMSVDSLKATVLSSCQSHPHILQLLNPTKHQSDDCI